MQQAIEVCVPEGVIAGDEFLIDYQGQQITATCPKGCMSGDFISLHVDGPEVPPQAAAVDVTVPEGCFPGMDFVVAYEHREYVISVPDFAAPGDLVTVDLPIEAPESPDTSAAPESPGTAGPRDSGFAATDPLPAPPLGDDVFAEPGMLVVIQGLRSKPELNGERATLVEWDAIKGRWKVSVGGGSDEVPIVLGVKPDNLRSS